MKWSNKPSKKPESFVAASQSMIPEQWRPVFPRGREAFAGKFIGSLLNRDSVKPLHPPHGHETISCADEVIFTSSRKQPEMQLD